MLQVLKAIIRVMFTRIYNVIDWFVLFYLAFQLGQKSITTVEFFVWIVVMSLISAIGETFAKTLDK